MTPKTLLMDYHRGWKFTGPTYATKAEFAALDLLFLVHNAVAACNDGGHVYFEGLVRLDHGELTDLPEGMRREYPADDGLPTYHVGLGS